MYKTMNFVLLFASGLLFEVKYLASAANDNTTLINSGTLFTTISKPSQNPVSQDNGIATMNASSNAPGNSEVDNASKPLTTTDTTLNKRSRNTSLSTLPIENSTYSTIAASSGTTLNSTHEDKLVPKKEDSSGLPTISLPTEATRKTPVTPEKKAPAKGSLKLILIILITFIGVIVLIFLVLWCRRKKKQRHSFNLYHKSPEDAEIPLSSAAVEKSDSQNLSEQKIDIHDMQPPAETSASEEPPKEDNGSDAVGIDLPADEMNSTSSTVPKDDEPDKLSMDSCQTSLLIPDDGELKSDGNYQADDGNTIPSVETSLETLNDQMNENNNNNSKQSIHYLKRRGIDKETCDSLREDAPASSVTRRYQDEYFRETEEREKMCPNPFMTASFEDDEGRCSGADLQAAITRESSFSDIMLLNVEPWAYE